MDLVLYVLIGGSVAINLAVSAQVYALHKSVLDLKQKLDVQDCKEDTKMRKQIASELGTVVETNGKSLKSDKVDASLDINRESTLFEGETVAEVKASIESGDLTNSAVSDDVPVVKLSKEDTDAITAFVESVHSETEQVTEQPEPQAEEQAVEQTVEPIEEVIISPEISSLANPIIENTAEEQAIILPVEEREVEQVSDSTEEDKSGDVCEVESTYTRDDILTASELSTEDVELSSKTTESSDVSETSNTDATESVADSADSANAVTQTTKSRSKKSASASKSKSNSSKGTRKKSSGTKK